MNFAKLTFLALMLVPYSISAFGHTFCVNPKDPKDRNRRTEANFYWTSGPGCGVELGGPVRSFAYYRTDLDKDSCVFVSKRNKDAVLKCTRNLTAEQALEMAKAEQKRNPTLFIARTVQMLEGYIRDVQEGNLIEGQDGFNLRITKEGDDDEKVPRASPASPNPPMPADLPVNPPPMQPTPADEATARR